MDQRTLATLIALCATYKVNIIVGAVPQDLKGPRQCGCCVIKRDVYVPLNWTDGRRRQGDLHEAVNLAEILHELMHVVLHPHGASIDVVPEDWILMQVERAIAADLFKRHLPSVIGWQQDSISPLVAKGFAVLGYNLLGSVPNYIYTADWQRGITLAQRLGVLTHVRGASLLDAMPTYALPKWSRLTSKQRASWDVASL